MGLREIWAKVCALDRAVSIARQVDPYLEMAKVIHGLEGRAVLFEHVRGSTFPAIAGICSDRDFFALALGVTRDRLLFALADALARPVAPPLVETAPCQELVESTVDLGELPILTHLPSDGAPYVTAGVAIIKDPEFGRNMAIHRLMRLDERSFATRLVESRGTHTAFSRTEADVEMAVCIGNDVHVLLAAAIRL